MFYWDMTSCETALLPLYLGKKFHPELFKGWDIIKEMKRFYSEIYKIDMTDSDAERILKGMPPL
jgi:iron complex transport system substrate-binding protein